MKILLIENDNNLNLHIINTLEEYCFDVVSCSDDKVAIKSINKSYDLYLINIRLCQDDDYKLLKEIKIINPKSNIYLLSEQTDINTIMDSYNAGCDDFIKLPFDAREIVAKIQYTLRIMPNTIKINSWIYNAKERLIRDKSRKIIITVKEASLFEILIENNGYFVSKEKIEERVWGISSSKSHVRQLVSKLRKSLPSDIIENNTSNGYKVTFRR
jgi:DNA-binding response OmpR family regulator